MFDNQHSYKRILIVISHSQDFLNGICTNIIHMHRRKLHYYGVSRSLLYLLTYLFYVSLFFRSVEMVWLV